MMTTEVVPITYDTALETRLVQGDEQRLYVVTPAAWFFFSLLRNFSELVHFVTLVHDVYTRCRDRCCQRPHNAPNVVVVQQNLNTTESAVQSMATYRRSYLAPNPRAHACFGVLPDALQGHWNVHGLKSVDQLLPARD